ncbi:kinase-like domain-containing protein [Syncephalis fuscata]|nr:kinase-like domain-containing protein [Syncephalis fuscata]
MNDELQELQNNELEALEAIFMEDFSRIVAKTAWKNAPSLPEFRIHLTPMSDHLKAFVSLNFHLENPRGISDALVQQIQQEVQKKAHTLCGNEMIYELVTFVQERITLEDTSTEFGLNQEEQEERARTNKLQRVANRAEHSENQALARKIEEELARKEQLRSQRTQQMENTKHTLPIDPLILTTANIPTKTVTFDATITLEQLDQELVFRSVTIGHCIGEGMIGKTWAVQPIHSNTMNASPLLLAMKEIQIENEHYLSSEGKLQLQLMEKELGRFKSCRHNHLIAIYESKLARIDGGWRLQVLMSHEPGGSIRDLLRRCGTLHIPLAINYAQQVLQALGHLHACNFIHKDLRAHHIFVHDGPSQDTIVKVGSVSFMRRLLDMHRSFPLSKSYAPEKKRLWIPPELKDQSELYNRKSDIWDFGVFLVEMLWGLEATTNHNTPMDLLSNTLQVPNNVIQLLKRLFQIDPKQRPSVMEVLNDPVFKYAQDTTLPMQLLFGSSDSRSHPSTKLDVNYHHPVGMLYGTSPLDAPVSSMSTISRYEADFEEIEFLGKGGFGEVIKKVRLDPMDIEENRSIRREITTLSRLHHQHVVRYYTSWIEDDKGVQWDTDSSDGSFSDANSDEEDEDTTSDHSFSGLGSIKAKTCDIMNDSSSTRSYSGIKYRYDAKHRQSSTSSSMSFSFKRSSSQDGSHNTMNPQIQRSGNSLHEAGEEESEEGDDDDDDGVVNRDLSGRSHDKQYRVLYIQMEYCENKTLRDAIEEGVDDSEAWRLFRQILEGLAYIHNEGMIHRDLKPSNIFLDANGDVKIGDFGLAVLSQSGFDMSGHQTSYEPNDANSLTSGVGTALYVSPEVASGQDTGTRYNHKGIIFFELCYRFSTAMERITVIRNLRLPSIDFPIDFPKVNKANQYDIIRRLLDHSARDRPSSIQLLQDKALPPKLEDAYLQECIRSIARPDTPYYERLMTVLFAQHADRMTEYTFDVNSGNTALDPLDSLTFAHIRDCVTDVFRRHGAIELSTPLLIPKTDNFKDKKVMDLMDNSGGLVQLPYDLTVPFARYICRNNITNIKRFVFGQVYRNNIVGGQPRMIREVDFDIVTPRMADYAPDAEVIRVVDEVLDEFPPFQGGRCLFLLNHTDVTDIIFDYCRIPVEARRDIAAVLGLPGRSTSLIQARTQLTEQYRLPRSALDELALFHIQGELGPITTKLRGMLNEPTLIQRFDDAVSQVKQLMQRAKQMGVQRRLLFAPLLALNYDYYIHGMIFNAVMERKSGGIIAAGGRYDALVKKFRHPAMIGAKRTHAVGVNFAIQKFVTAMLQYQMERFDKVFTKRPESERQFGSWAAKRCDVYVASFGKGLLNERLAVARELWSNYIAADVQYEDSIANGGIDYILQECRHQGISWIVLVRHHRVQESRGTTNTRDVIKVKSVLKKVEIEVLRSELCAYLSAELAEQTRVEHLLSGAKSRRHDSSGLTLHYNSLTGSVSDNSNLKEKSDSDRGGKPPRQQHRQKQLYIDKAMQNVAQVMKDIAHGDVPILALDLNEILLKRIGQCNLLDTDQFKDIVKLASPAQRDYVHHIRKTMLEIHQQQKRKMVWLYSFRDDYSLLYRFESSTGPTNSSLQTTTSYTPIQK